MATDCEVPTRPRIKALLLKQGLLSSYYPTRIVISIGIASTMCGVSMAIFGVVAFLIETPIPAICSGVWVGILCMLNGTISVLSGNRPHNTFLLYFNLFAAILTTAATGFMSIFTASSVFNDQLATPNQSNEQNDAYVAKVPNAMINTLLLVFSSLTCVLSLINFCICAREACQCSSDGVLGINDPLNHLGLDTVEKRKRIMSWIVEQSLAKERSYSTTNDYNEYKQKLRPLNSTSTVSTKLSGYAP